MGSLHSGRDDIKVDYAAGDPGNSPVRMTSKLTILQGPRRFSGQDDIKVDHPEGHPGDPPVWDVTRTSRGDDLLHCSRVGCYF